MKNANTIGLITAGILLLALIGVVFFSNNGYFDYQELQKEKAALIEQNDRARAENWELRRQAARLNNDPAYIEHIARTEFGMVGKNDVVYTFKANGENR